MMHNTYTKIIAGIHKYFKEARVDKAVIGVSGGIDSSLCLKLLVDTLGADNVTAILMPEKGITNEENMQHAKMLCNFLKVDYFTISINKFLTDFLTLPWKPNDLAQINTKARIRMIILYNFANTRNCLVVGTSNKTELMIGYGTKHGDLAVDIDIIGDLYKEDVFKLAEHLGLPNELIEKPPSAELYPGQTDEDELGLSYKEIDNVLKYIEKGTAKEELINKGLNPNSVHKVYRLVNINSHKTNPTPVISAKTKNL
ncbi:NAD+ synthase [Candidatus Peregrinibacteria bacterium]|nr:NAD+ synthase [Candidatus Peregrinibacteria bacterium]